MADLTLEEIQRIKDRCKVTNTGEFQDGVTLYCCPACEKKFAISDLKQWAYKRRTRSKRKNESILHFCSYTCARKYDKVFNI